MILIIHEKSRLDVLAGILGRYTYYFKHLSMIMIIHEESRLVVNAGILDCSRSAMGCSLFMNIHDRCNEYSWELEYTVRTTLELIARCEDALSSWKLLAEPETVHIQRIARYGDAVYSWIFMNDRSMMCTEVDRCGINRIIVADVHREIVAISEVIHTSDFCC